MRVFVDEGAPMARLLGRLAAAQPHWPPRPGPRPPDYLDRLAQAFQRGAPRAASDRERVASGEGLVEPLSDRELQVLRLLAAGKSNQQIAEELVVVLDTVKKHVGHILDKLGAANRTQAVARAWAKAGILYGSDPLISSRQAALEGFHPRIHFAGYALRIQ